MLERLKEIDINKKKKYALKQNYTFFLQTIMFFKGSILKINKVCKARLKMNLMSYHIVGLGAEEISLAL